MAQRYIVKREGQDGGPMGTPMEYVAVTNPRPGEKIYHGNFKPRVVACGQFDADSKTVYDPIGEVTEESFMGGVETF